jgi:HEAT repeat protein
MPERYEIREKIGQGGVGAVYKAFDTQLKREVALKRLLTDEEIQSGENAGEITEDLLKEATTLSALQHPNIVTVYDVGKDEKGPFVVMELLRGETFDETIQRGALPLEDFKPVVTQTLEAMIAAQALNVVHRDLKPGNLMVIWLPSGKFQIKILDFGLAKFGKLPSEQTADQEDGILGSIFFMAPEQFERVKLDARTDMYALGCIYYYAVTGKYPFQGDHAPQVMASHLQNRFTPLASLRPDLPIWLCEWVEWLLSREMKDRPVNAKEAFDYFNREESGGKRAATRAIATGAGSVALRKAAPVSTPQPARAPTRLIASGGGARSAGVTVVGAVPAGAHSMNIAPGAQPVPGRPVAFPGGGAKKSHFPKWAMITIPLLLVAVVVVLFLRNREPDIVVANYEELKEIIESEEPVGNAETARLLMAVMKQGGNNGLAASSALLRLKGEGVEQAILNSLPRVTDDERVALIGIVVERHIDGALVDIAPYLADSHPKEVREAAVYAIGALGGESEIPDLLEALKGTRDDKTRGILEQALVQISLGIKDPDKRSSRIRTALSGADAAYKLSLLKILCHLGGERAWVELQTALDGADRDERNTIVANLGNWPDFAPGEELFKLATESTDPIEKAVATRSFTGLLSRQSEVSAEKKVEYLKTLLGLAKQNREKMDLLGVASQFAEESALALVESYGDDPQLGGTAKGVAKNMAKALESRIAIAGEATLAAKSARIIGDGDIEYDLKEDAIVGWNQPYAGLRWAVKFSEPGSYAVTVVQAGTTSKNTYTVSFAGHDIEAAVADTGSEFTFKPIEIGTINVMNPGTFVVEVTPKTLEGYRLMSLRALKLKRVGDVE